MKNFNRVQQLIDELKSLTDNQFELHRINLLERDLTCPPSPEVIDDNHQKFDGVTYFKDKSGHYRATFHIHRAVYSYFTGDIPKGYDIHHKNFNADDNRIDNLQKLSRANHQKIHKPKGSQAVIFDSPKNFVCKNCGKSFQTTNTRNNTYCSAECRKKGNQHYENRTCIICGKIFKCRTDHKTKTCSGSCANKMWRKS